MNIKSDTPDLGNGIAKGAAFDPELVNRVMGRFGHGGFLNMEYVSHGEDWVELASTGGKTLLPTPEPVCWRLPPSSV